MTDKTVRERARAGIADIFGLAVDAVQPEMRFATDFQAAPPPDFKRNEYDRLPDDIRDVANREIARSRRSARAR